MIQPLFPSTRWVHQAACRGDETEAWFTNPYLLSEADRQRLAELCHICPVWWDCLQFARSSRAVQCTMAGRWWFRGLNGRHMSSDWTTAVLRNQETA